MPSASSIKSFLAKLTPIVNLHSIQEAMPKPSVKLVACFNNTTRKELQLLLQLK